MGEREGSKEELIITPRVTLKFRVSTQRFAEGKGAAGLDTEAFSVGLCAQLADGQLFSIHLNEGDE